MRPPRPSEPDDLGPAMPAPSRAAVDALYQDRILEHFRHPHGKGVLDHPDAEASVHNPLCGESVTVTVSVEQSASSPRVRDVRFQSDGCSIAQASASMMTDLVRGATVSEFEGLAARMRALVNGHVTSADETALGPAVAFSVIHRVPARAACALLAWRALGEALSNF
jgi:nitrogen fixation NifU-like protein